MALKAGKGCGSFGQRSIYLRGTVCYPITLTTHLSPVNIQGTRLEYLVTHLLLVMMSSATLI